MYTFFPMIVLVIISISIVHIRTWEKSYDTFEYLETIDCRKDPCPEVYIPVCASDKKTYVNICKLVCYNLKYRDPHHRPLTARHYGPCDNWGPGEVISDEPPADIQKRIAKNQEEEEKAKAAEEKAEEEMKKQIEEDNVKFGYQVKPKG